MSNVVEVKRNGGQSLPIWTPRIWSGMTFGTWLRLLIRNKFKVSPTPKHIGMLLGVSTLSGTMVPLSYMQKWIYGKRIETAEIKSPPIFILGHWRSGTTLLHEYLIHDKRFSYPDTYMCYCPSHFLLSQYFIRWMTSFLLPSKRPMDNMAFGWDRPQEEEFALANLGAKSTYLNIAFPRREPDYQRYIDFEGVSDEQLEEWKSIFMQFIKTLTVHDSRPLVLKSPAHTGRLHVLRELFPDARFVHIHRDPYTVFPSTVNLWTKLGESQAFQNVAPNYLEEYVLENFTRMYRSYFKVVDDIPSGQLVETSYQAIVDDPVEELRRIYAELDLGGFDSVEADYIEFANRNKRFRTNKFEISDETRAKITDRWEFFFKHYGYSVDSVDCSPEEPQFQRASV